MGTTRKRKPGDLPGNNPRILVFDIETAPIQAYVWKIWDENVALNQIISDWHILSWAAKWVGDTKLIYRDQRKAIRVEDDKEILEDLRDLLSEADVVITQNGKKFDSKKVNARLAIHGLPPPAPYKHIDTLVLAKKHFAFTSNKLEFLSGKLCGDAKKKKSRKFSGFELWSECLKGNIKAWREMEAYNKADVLATEALYHKLAKWGIGVDLNIFRPGFSFRCQCGSTNLWSRGFNYTTSGKYRRFQCRNCGAWTSERGAENNQLPKVKRASLRGRGY